MQTQVYVDETKAKGYVVAAAAIAAGDVDAVRRSLRGLLPRGQRRLHMVAESNPLRRKILAALTDEPVQVDLYVAGATHRTNIERRRACLEGLVADIAADCTLLTLESDETQDRRDRQDLALLTRRAGCHGLRRPASEPLCRATAVGARRGGVGARARTRMDPARRADDPPRRLRLTPGMRKARA